VLPKDLRELSGEDGRRAGPIDVPRGGLQRSHGDPEPATFVAEEPTPAAQADVPARPAQGE
jgi:hypothetical protein